MPISFGDQAIQNIFQGVIANGLFSFISYLGNSGKRMLLEEKIEQQPDLQKILMRGDEIIKKLNELDSIENNKLSSFLSSPEIDMIIRQIYSLRLSDDSQQFRSLNQIRDEFIRFFTIFVGYEDINIRNKANELLDTIIEGCDKSLTLAIDNNILCAHEAKSVFRHRMLLNELAGIQKTLSFLSSQKNLDLETINDFEEKYREQVAYVHGKITPPNFDKSIKININQLYVEPNFVKISTKKGDEQNILKMKEFLLVIHRIVILGTPGGGKSTFTHKLCSDLATNYNDRLFAGRKITPILVMLRDFGAEMKERNCSILQFIESNTNSKYQLQPPAGFFEYILLNGRALVIFDGLDELLDTSYRQEISNAIEAFCALYPSVPIIATSREVGYEQAPLDKDIFDIFQLAPFNDKQVSLYVNNWFSIDVDLTFEQKQQKIASFIEESEIVSDIRANPLMLALMCNIYRGDNYIPRNRPDVYEKCAIMLFERWDKSRGINAAKEIEELEAHIKPLMMYLAYWIYSNEALQSGVTERNLIEKATEYLFQKRFEDMDEAENAARKFIEFCKGRAWVFTDTGTTKDGDNLYQFTHRTFLEYFTASYLVRTNPIPEKLELILFPKIIKREWDVVAQLAFQLQNKYVEGAADELLTSLIRITQDAREDVSFSMISFAARCLEFIVPRPKITRDITMMFIEKWVAWGLSQMKKMPDNWVIEFIRPHDIMGFLLNSAIENRKIIIDSISSFIMNKIKIGSDEEILLILEIGLHLQISLFSGRNRRKAPEGTATFCKSLSEQILNENWTQISNLYINSANLAIDLERNRKINIEELVKLHGIEALFMHRKYIMFQNTFSLSIFEGLLNLIGRLPYETNANEPLITNSYNELTEIGKIFIDSNPSIDFIKVENLDLMDRHIYFSADVNKKRKIKYSMERLFNNPDAAFGIFILFASAFEFCSRKNNLDSINSDESNILNKYKKILFARNKRFKSEELQKLIKNQNFNFSEAQEAFILNWIYKKINIIKN